MWINGVWRIFCISTLLFHEFKEIYVITGNVASLLFMINNGLNDITTNVVRDPFSHTSCVAVGMAMSVGLMVQTEIYRQLSDGLP